MGETFTESRQPRLMSQRLADGRTWPLEQSLAVIHRLALSVRSLHENGRTHRAISATTISLDERLHPHLEPPAGPSRFGGDDADPECCPPELAQGEALELPEEIEEAAAALRNAGHALDPRRIDVYQLGTVLARLVTGEPVLGYLYDPLVKARVPAVARSVLQRALGDDEVGPFENCDSLIAALDEAMRRAGSQQANAPTQDTPAEGSVILPDGDTPAVGNQAPPAPQAKVDLPFARLGHYRIIERIGRGGMGDVYRGYDESLDRQVAIKVLPPELARDEDFVRRFRAEATAAAGLTHANVVPVYFIGEDEGHHFFAMRFVDGESLSACLDRQGRFPLGEAVALLDQCLEGLQAAHAKDLIHRDIKPGNILLERETGRPVLVDFGLVRRIGQQTRMTATGMVMGTVDYMAPEQARGQKTDCRADIYAMGVLFYQVLAGRLPFEAETPTAMIFQHAYEEPYPLADAAPDLPQPIVDIVARMMAKAPDERYATCEDVRADIAAFREGRELAPVVSADGSQAGRSRTGDSSGSKSRDSAYDDGVATSGLSEAEDIELPEKLDELADDSPLRRARDFAATMFRRHAPEFVQNLQSTTQQVDGAVAHYERHRDRLAKVKSENLSILTELAEQIETNRQAAAAARQQADQTSDADQAEAALASQQECEDSLAALQTQHDEQRQRGKQQAKANKEDYCFQQIDHEVPQHRVEISKPFYLGKYEVTQAQWQAVMESNPSESKAPLNPVENMTWDETQSFLAKLNLAYEQQGVQFGLPTEAQWEYACRAGTTTEFYFGDDAAMLPEHGWFKRNAGRKTHPVGQWNPNAWGLYDMHGNVWEGCSDWHSDSYYRRSPSVDPTGPPDSTGPPAGSRRVCRGGSWDELEVRCRSTFRGQWGRGSSDDNGLRVAAFPVDTP